MFDIIMVLSLTFGQRFALPIGDFQIPLMLVVTAVLVTVGLLSGRIIIAPIPLLLYLLFSTTILAATLISRNPGSFQSLAYFLVIYGFLITRTRHGSLHGALSRFQGIMLAAAIIGIIQFSTQAFGLLLYEDVFASLPSNIILEGYNYRIPVWYGMDLYKANGIFFLEPSLFSMAIALALLSVLWQPSPVRRKWLTILLFSAALLLSFSGTGLVVMAVGLLVSLRHLGPRRMVPVGVVIAAASAAFFLSPFGDYTLQRQTEFQDSGKSASIRFLNPYIALWSILDREPKLLFRGHGPGTVSEIQREFKAHDVWVLKLTFEYGLLSTIALATLLLYTLLRSPVWTTNRMLAICLLLMYGILNASLLVAPIVLLCTYFLNWTSNAQSGVEPVRSYRRWFGGTKAVPSSNVSQW